MTHLLYPGRHILFTKFQLTEISRIVAKRIGASETIDDLIFAVTSSDQDSTRYNPVDFSRRVQAAERFSHELAPGDDFSTKVYGIPHYQNTDRFAEIILKEIEDQTEGRLLLVPSNTIVITSTPALISMYEGLGFNVEWAECTNLDPEKYKTERPLDLVRRLAYNKDWQNDPLLREKLANSSFNLFRDHPEIPSAIFRIFNEPLLTESGSLTEERHYDSYAYRMGNSQIIEVKYEDIKNMILPGKIVDEGCADGALLARISQDFEDSDLYGVEIAAEFIARLKERKRLGDFRDAYVHFLQRNIMDDTFTPDSVDTVICNSTVHELYSYMHQQSTVREYFRRKHEQLSKGGRLLIRDVVAPENKEQEVYMLLNDEDGSNCQVYEKDPGELSTYSRFKRFTKDFLARMRAEGRRDENTRTDYKVEEIEGRKYIVTSLKNAAEFMLTKDYTQNWNSESNEEFTFWDFDEWKGELENAGFHILEGSRTYTNDWIEENSWDGKVQLFGKKGEELVKFENPPTNIVIYAAKE